MSQVFGVMAAGKPCEEFQRLMAETPLEELQREAEDVSDDQLPWVLSYAEKIVAMTGVQKALLDGAVLQAVSLIESRPQRRELVDCLYEDLGLSRSEGHRSIQIWLAFGVQLTAERKLQKQFCVASLAILSEARTPPAARDEALQLARNGEKITMKRAVALQAQHAVVGSSQPAMEPPSQPVAAASTPSRKRSSRGRKWLFIGEAARIEVIPTAANQLSDVAAVIRDLEAAIDQLRSGGTAQHVA